MSAVEVSASGRLRPGTQLGKYEILRFIAEGGMGELYVARASGIEGFQKTVALKRILSRFAGREQHIQMFLDEARVAATLHHPNIVSVFDIGDEAGVLFFSMEYVHGTDVRALLEASRTAKQPVPLDTALEIAIGVAAGLHHAHQAGIVHRDVSPSNVLLAHDGGVKVTDFGVAKATERTTETRPGMLKGKVSYMSPEQCRDEDIDRRSDVFAIGILLYELTCGEKPFAGTSDFAIMEQIVHRDPVPPSTQRADYPPELEAIVMRALARDRDKRYPTAQDVQRELRQVARDRKLDASPLRLEILLRELFGEQVDTWRREEVEATRATARPTAVTVPERAQSAKPEVSAVGEASAIVEPQRTRVRWPIVAAGIGAIAIAGVFAMRGGDRDEPSAAPSRAADTAPSTSAPSNTAPSPTTPAPIVEIDAAVAEPSFAATVDAAVPVEAKPVATKSAVRPKTTVRAPVETPQETPKVEPPKLETPNVEPPKVETPSTPVAPPDAAPTREVPWDPDSPTFPKSH